MTYSERLEKWKFFITNRMYDRTIYQNNVSAWKALFDYLEDISIPIPNYDNAYVEQSWVINELYYILNNPNNWGERDERIINFLKLIKKNNGPYGLNVEYLIVFWAASIIEKEETNLESLFPILRKYGASEFDIWKNLINSHQIKALAEHFVNYNDNEFLKFCIDNSERWIDKIFINDIALSNFLVLLCRYKPDLLEKYFIGLTTYISPHFPFTYIHVGVCELLLNLNPSKYEQNLGKVLALPNLAIDDKIQLEKLLISFFPNKYQLNLKLAHEYFEDLLAQNTTYNWAPTLFRRFHTIEDSHNKYYGLKINACVDILVNGLPLETVVSFLDSFFKKTQSTELKVLKYLYERLGQESLSILFRTFKYQAFSDNDSLSMEVRRNLVDSLSNLELDKIEDELWSLANSKSKNVRNSVAQLIAKNKGENAISKATLLIFDEKADARQTGALILSLIRTDKSQEILMNAIDSEKDDNTRDTMLEGIAGLLPTAFSQAEITQKVQKAKDRNKLEKPLEWWLDESKLPAVYWKNTNQTIDNETIRFLFYRMSRTKDIRTDIEAKPLILSIDRTTSGSFAKSLIKTYFDNGADAKYKFCLTLGGLLGDDEIIDLMKRKVNEFAEGSRGKMAEYTVKALALQGSTKALRAVEFFSRKYKNKNKNVGAAANESFGIAAEELGITPYDLADSIIPNFDFDGLFREFEAGGESYRAFVNTDFKIAYLNEDNKMMKSPPKVINKELAEEFKEISKEIRDIVKSQSGRLEQYLVIQRKWSAEKWQEFFLGNPIMFAYAVRLIWGAYDTNGELKFVFRCEQDQTLIDENSEEIELSEDLFVGMVHPISLTFESIEYWNASLYDANIEAIFPQLKRPVVLLKEEDKNLRISEEFTGIKIGGYTFVGKLEKMGWFRGSVIDGGGISSYYKDFSELGITAVVMQIGSIGVGYLEDNAEVGDLMFAKKGSVKFGSYMYDEPDKTDDSRLFAFGEVPPIVYSEVLADMMALRAIAIT